MYENIRKEVNEMGAKEQSSEEEISGEEIHSD
jgi:hypothetical protein